MPSSTIGMDFRLLGPLEVWDGSRRVAVSGRLHPKILAGLLLNAGRVVPLSWLVGLLWDDDPPATAYRQAQNAVAALRRQLTPGGDGLIERVGQGYRLNVDDEAVDLRRFEALIGKARRQTEAGDQLAACDLYERLLGLWSGPALAGMTGRVLRAAAMRFNDLHISACEDFAESALAAGEPERVIATLDELVGRNPLRQRLAARLMHALYQSGRVSEALQCFDTIRDRLADELGLDPGTELANLHMRILQDDPALLPQPAGSAQDGSAATPQHAVPAQLPADVNSFTGRHEQLAVLDRLRLSGARAGIVSTIAGIGGVGKTALAVHWGHGNREHFPDGQLYVNLRGFDEREPLTPYEAVSRLLRSLGHPAARIPSEVREAAALYRSTLADKRALVVLDNARSSDQVRLLLPSGSGCLALVTSRNRLSALIVSHDAQSVDLETLNPNESLDLLTHLIGAGVAGELDATKRLAELCGYLPLALRVAAANHTQNPRQTLAAYVSELEEDSRLARLSIAADRDTNLTAVFDQSYRTLSPAAQHIFVHVGLIPGDDFTIDLVAAIADVPADTVRAAFDELTTAHLLDEHQLCRFRLHDLIRHYASQTVSQVLDEDRRASARDRMLDWYGDRSNPYFPELDNILAACEAFSTHPQLWKLANTLGLIANAGGDPRRSRHYVELALRTAKHHRHTEGQIYSLDALGTIAWVLGEHENAVSLRNAAFDLLSHTDDSKLQGNINNNLGIALKAIGRFHGAEIHLRRANEIAVTGNLPELTVVSSMNLGSLFRFMGRFHDALTSLLHANEIAQNTGTPYRKVSVLVGLGLVCNDMGRYAEAVTHASQALDIAEELAATRYIAQATQLLGRVCHRMGKPDESATYFDRSIFHASRGHNTDEQVESLHYQAELLLDAGDTQQAVANIAMAKQVISARQANQAELAFHARLLCRVHAESGDWKTAIQHGEQATAIYRTTHPHPLGLAHSLDVLGDTLNGHGNGSKARDCWTEALDIYTTLDAVEAAELRGKLTGVTIDRRPEPPAADA